MYKNKVSFSGKNKNCTFRMSQNYEINISLHNEGVFDHSCISVIEKNITTFIEASVSKIANENYIFPTNASWNRRDGNNHIDYWCKNCHACDDIYFIEELDFLFQDSENKYINNSFKGSYFPYIDILLIDFDNHSGYNHKFDNDELVIELNKMKAHLNTALKNSRIKIYFAKGLEFDIKYNKPVVIDEEINENKDVNKKAIRKNYESDYFDPIEEAMDRVTREEDQGDLFSEW